MFIQTKFHEAEEMKFKIHKTEFQKVFVTRIIVISIVFFSYFLFMKLMKINLPSDIKSYRNYVHTYLFLVLSFEFCCSSTRYLKFKLYALGS